MHNIQQMLVSWGPLGLFLLAVIESAGIPNPGGSDFLLVILAAAKPEEALLCAVLVSVGSLLGSAVFLEITRKGGEKFLARYTATGRGAKFRGWFLRYGMLTVFISALVPIPILPFKVFAACAGAMGCTRWRYFWVLAAARIPRYFALAYLGAQLGENSWGWVTGHKWHLLAVAAVLFMLLYAMIYLADRGRRATAEVE